jgi:hypothetical protein
MQKSRITNLSTRFLRLYKNTVLVVLLAAMGFFVYRLFQQPLSIFMCAAWSWVIWNYIKINRKVFHVEFDDEFLYLIRRDSDILIPLENIKSVDLKTMGGLYEVKLYHPEVVGDLIYYKPSLLYPLNYKSKDLIADVLREKIEIAKKRPIEFQKNALLS